MTFVYIVRQGVLCYAALSKSGSASMYGVDFFAGAGGLSLGAELAGVDVYLAVERDFEACKTYKRNHPDTVLLNEDISSIEELPICNSMRPLAFFGGPPCQGFSTSNQKTRKMNNPDNWLFGDFLRLTEKYQPDIVVIENVKGLKETAKGYFLNVIIEELKLLDYSVDCWVLNSQDFGVPQKRSRLFIVGSRLQANITPPAPLDSTPVTVGEAISDLPKIENGCMEDSLPYFSAPKSHYAAKMRGDSHSSFNNFVTNNARHIIDRYKHIPPGGNWQNIPLDLMGNYKKVTNCHTGIYRRLVNEEASVVIGNFRKNMLIHPAQNRGLSVREAARLQSFPDCFYFEGSIGFQQQQVGNAVPPLLAKAVFETIINNLK